MSPSNHHAYTVVAVCQPSRQVMLTGLYPDRNGSMGFPARGDVSTPIRKHQPPNRPT